MSGYHFNLVLQFLRLHEFRALGSYISYKTWLCIDATCINSYERIMDSWQGRDRQMQFQKRLGKDFESNNTLHLANGRSGSTQIFPISLAKTSVQFNVT